MAPYQTTRYLLVAWLPPAPFVIWNRGGIVHAPCAAALVCARFSSRCLRNAAYGDFRVYFPVRSSIGRFVHGLWYARSREVLDLLGYFDCFNRRFRASRGPSNSSGTCLYLLGNICAQFLGDVPTCRAHGPATDCVCKTRCVRFVWIYTDQ